jgi:serine/threonine-protein kinase
LDSNYFQALLDSAATKLSKGEKLIVIIDGLDEVEIAPDSRSNTLYLPSALPNQVYIITTFRPSRFVNLQVELSEDYTLDASSRENQEDIRQYLSSASKTETISRWLKREGITADLFIDTLLDKSEGNFMYLHYILQDLEISNSLHISIYDLPQGLKGYYDAHWRQMRSEDEALWLSYRLPVLCFLAAITESISVSELSHLCGLPTGRVRVALGDWLQFLDKTIEDGEEKYRIYHSSFQDYLRHKEEVGEISLKNISNTISDVLLEDWKKFKGT